MIQLVLFFTFFAPITNLTLCFSIARGGPISKATTVPSIDAWARFNEVSPLKRNACINH